MIRYIQLSFFAILVSCGGSTEPESPSEVWPTDIEAENARLLESNPNAVAVSLFNEKQRGFVFYPNGRVVFVPFRAISDLSWNTRVTELQGNRLCVAQVESWSGACMEIFSKGNDAYFIRGEYGNGANFSYHATAKPELSQ